jgi:predicted amidohydrolase YtcJ
MGLQMSRNSKISADLVLKNALVWTADNSQPYAEAVAIKGSDIIHVGRSAEMDALFGNDTLVIDLEGKLVLPGFNDCHTHFLETVLVMSSGVDLYRIDSLERIQALIKEVAQKHSVTDWIYGIRWFPNHRSGKWPSRLDLDAVEDVRPIAIYDIDYHTAWVNTPALKLMGYNEVTPDPKGGKILRESNVFPTGILFERAHDLIPPPTRPEENILTESFTRQFTSLNKLGITSIGNMEPMPENIMFTLELAKADMLSLRINHWSMLRDGIENAKTLRELCGESEKVTVNSVKAFMDGVFSNRSAWLVEPYGDDPEQFGYPVMPLDEFSEKVTQADKEGFQVITHAIGDRAVREVLNTYEHVEQVNGKRDRRHRIEHVEIVHPDDLNRFATNNVIAAMMPVHKCTPQFDEYMPAILDEERQKYSCAWRKIVDSGAHLAFGTDWPCIDLVEASPIQQIYAAVTGIHPQLPDSSPQALKENRLTVDQAIRSYTIEGAYAESMENRKGSITAGKLADLCVLSQNIIEIDPSRYLDTKVIMTVFDGKVVFDDR